VTVSFFVLLTACGGFRDTSVGRLAAHDLECPIEQVEITRDMPFEKSFRGCGREVTYVRSRDGSDPIGVARSADGWAVRPAPTAE
jgi:hypothetical protein